MSSNMRFPWVAAIMIAGGIFLSSARMPTTTFNWDYFSNWWKKAVPIVVVNTEGTTLLMLHEKTRATLQQTLDVRAASDFVKQHKFKNYMAVDVDDPWATTVLSNLQTKLNLTPPVLAAVRIKDNKVDSVVKARKWETGIEDILK